MTGVQTCALPICLKYGKFTNKDGLEQNTCDIVAQEMQLLGGRQGAGAPGGEEGGGASYARAPAPASRPPAARPAPAPAASKAGSGFDDMDDDIPF